MKQYMKPAGSLLPPGGELDSINPDNLAYAET